MSHRVGALARQLAAAQPPRTAHHGDVASSPLPSPLPAPAEPCCQVAVSVRSSVVPPGGLFAGDVAVFAVGDPGVLQPALGEAVVGMVRAGAARGWADSR